MNLFTAFRRTSPTPTLLLMGLGNPGPDYATTRHNIGRRVVQQFLANLKNDPNATIGISEKIPSGRGLTCTVGVVTLYIIDYAGYMNTSGEIVEPALTRFHLPPDALIVVHDELDLPEGRLRLRRGGSENGHNGLKSITEHIGSTDYTRLRMGIGRPPKNSETTIVDYVLGQHPVSQETLQHGAHALHLLVTEGLIKAQNTINQRP